MSLLRCTSACLRPCAMPSGLIADWMALWAAECPGLLRVVTLLAGWSLVSICHVLPQGTGLPDLPLSFSAGAASGWPVVLLCWVGAEVCLDLHGMLVRSVQATAAEVDPRIVVGPNGLYFSQRVVSEAYERWKETTELRRELRVVVTFLCATFHIKFALSPECGSGRYQALIAVHTVLVLAAVLGTQRLSSATRSLLGLLAISYSWILNVSLTAEGDPCWCSVYHSVFTRSTASACAMSWVYFCLAWVMCPVSWCHEKFKAVSSWAGCAATAYLKMLHRDGALRPEMDEDGRALLYLLMSMSVVTLLCYHIGARLSAANMRQYLQLLRSGVPHAREELLAGVHQHAQ